MDSFGCDPVVPRLAPTCDVGLGELNGGVVVLLGSEGSIRGAGATPNGSGRSDRGRIDGLEANSISTGSDASVGRSDGDLSGILVEL